MRNDFLTKSFTVGRDECVGEIHKQAFDDFRGCWIINSCPIEAELEIPKEEGLGVLCYTFYYGAAILVFSHSTQCN